MPKDVYNSHYEKLPNGEVRCIDNEIPFEIPENWAWVRVKHIVNVGSARRVHERDWRSTGVPFYRAREIGKLAEFGKVDNDLFIEQALYNEFSKSGVPLAGDLMVTAVGTLGKVYVVHENEVFYYKDGSVLCLENVNHLNPYFLKLAIESPCFINQYKGESQGTTVATLTMVRINEYLLPVPPLNEQNRIVAKIESLQPIIDKYSKAQQELDNLNSEVYNLLKKSILQEAIQGRLVPQDSNDEPATKLLERIRTEKQALVKQGKLKAKDITDSIIYKGDDNKYYEQIGSKCIDISDEIPFDIPHSWAWCRLETLVAILDGYRKPISKNQRKSGVYPYYGANGILDYVDDYIFDGEYLLVGEDGSVVTQWGCPVVNKASGKIWVNNHAHVLQECGKLGYYDYLFYALSAIKITQYIHGFMPKYSQGDLRKTLLPVPPISEQHRIVAKIEESFRNQ